MKFFQLEGFIIFQEHGFTIIKIEQLDFVSFRQRCVPVQLEGDICGSLAAAFADYNFYVGTAVSAV